jgi:hypothetical protein
MLQQTDEQLIAWVTNVLGDVTVSLAPPAADEDGKGVHLYLLDLLPTPPPSSQRLTPLQFSVRYLVTTWGKTPQVAHQLLGELALAAMLEEEMDLDLEPITPATWTALGTRPQPAFFLRVLVRQPRPDPATPLVRKPLVIQSGPAVTLSGRVIGPESIPIANARVEFPSLNQSTMTDSRGAFSFAAVPADMPITLVVKARGRVQQVTRDGPVSADPVVIELDLS